MMLSNYQIIKGNYLSISQNSRLNNARINNERTNYKLRGIQISSGNAQSFVSLTNLNLRYASLALHNKPQHIFMRNINVMQIASREPALLLNFDLRKDVCGKFMAKQDTPVVADAR